MIDGGNEYAQNNKGDPKGCIDHIRILKSKTNRQSNEDHQTRNNVEIDHSCDSAAPRLRFLFFLNSLNFLHYSMLEPFLSPPSTPIYWKGSLWGLAAHPGELRLTPEVVSLLRRAGFLTLKSFGGSGKLGSRKTKEKSLLPFFLDILCLPDWNTE